MENQKEHYRRILLFYFRKGKNALQARKKLRAVYGDEDLKRTAVLKLVWTILFKHPAIRTGYIVSSPVFPIVIKWDGVVT